MKIVQVVKLSGEVHTHGSIRKKSLRLATGVCVCVCVLAYVSAREAQIRIARRDGFYKIGTMALFGVVRVVR